MATDRRRAERVRVWFEVLRAHPPLEGVATISDLSAEGARLECSKPHPTPGQPIRVSIRAAGRIPVLLNGAVVRTAEKGFAVAFDKPNGEVEALLNSEPEAEVVELTETIQEVKAAPIPGKAARTGGKGTSPFREVLATCHGEGHWLAGRICTPPKRNLLDHLNGDESFLRLREVASPEQSERLAFIALRRDAIDILIPDPDQDSLEPVPIGNFVMRSLRCLLPIGLLEGKLSVLEKIRVSDFLMRCPPFIALSGCSLRLTHPERAPLAPGSHPIVIVNTRRVIGISDLAPSPAQDPLA